MNHIIRQLKKINHFLIVSHENPDGDAIGSALAIGLALEKLKKDVTLYNESPIPAIYRFLPSVSKIKQYVDRMNLFEAVIVLDCGGIDRVGVLAGELSSVPVIFNIDHHATNTGFGHFCMVDTKACATAEIVYRMIRNLKIPIGKEIATCIYTGILTDTGSFRFSNTTQESFSICDEMVSYGVKPHKVAQYVYGTYSLGRIKLLNLALDSIEITNNGKVSIMILTQEMHIETGTRSEDVDGLINYAKNIEDIKVAVLIHELKKHRGRGEDISEFHVSLRSDGSIDVADFASHFGGGGHYSAAGFSIHARLKDVKKKIIQMADKYFGVCDTN